MPLFYECAFRAACRNQPPPEIGELRAAHFLKWSTLFEALSWLTDEQRCDAIYGDWLCQLDAPGGENQLLTRNHLLTGGALDAHFLAELAQNANDAADGKPAEFRARLEGEWLIVANNGRRITARNLFGLSRFFVHLGAEEIHGLTQETIGRFGIGFKSCYRIAREVFIESWDVGRPGLVFRLPIARNEETASHAEPKRLAHVVDGLKKAGSPVSIGEAEPQRFGYCTPEFLPRLPAHVRTLVEQLDRTERGTVFCLHLNRTGAAEVRRIFAKEQMAAEELAPIFTPNLRLVQIGGVSLARAHGKPQADRGLADAVEAEKLTVSRETSMGATHQRMWRLRGTREGDRWEVALAADSKFLLTRADAAANIGSGREGGAYAFFRLGSVKWPLRFHLHVALPTNLSRGDWISEGGNLDAQIGRAMAGLAMWLEAHTDLWHPAWSPSALIEREPEADEGRAGHAVECLRKEVRARKLVRSLGGGFVTGAAARGLKIVDREDVREAWRRLASHPQFHELAPRLAFASPALGVNPTVATANDCLSVLAEIAAESAIDHPKHVQDAMVAALSIEPPSAQAIERVLAKVQLPRAEGRTIALSELAKARRSAHLAPGWHPFFAELLRWNDRRAVGGTVFGTALGGALEFAEPEFYVDWSELPDFFATVEAWGRDGEAFWSDHRAECPKREAARVVAALRLPSDRRGWAPITSYWLHDTCPPTCFLGLLDSRADASKFANKLKRWELIEAYDSAVANRLANELPSALTQCFEHKLGADPLAMLEEGAHASDRAELPLQWQKVMSDAERSAVASFRAQHPMPAAGKRLISTRLPEPFRSLLLKCDEFQLAPAWVTPLAWQAIARLKPSGYQTLPAVVFPDSLQNPARRNEVSELLLAQAHRWAGNELTEPEAAALNELCRDCNGNSQITLARGHPEFLRNILAVPGETSPQHCGGGKWHWHGRRQLPKSLTRVPHLVRACLSLDDAKAMIERRGESVPLVEEDVAPELRATPQFVAALTAAGGPAKLRYCAELSLRWMRGDEPLCDLRDLDFARHDDLLLVSRVVRPPDVTGYADALAKYLGFRNDAAVRQARTAGQSPVAIYEQHREKILAVFRRELVERVGYRVEHVLRELLQNAESAYASLAGPRPDARPFRVIVSGGAFENQRKVAIEHLGRAFNEPDNAGHPRDDIQQIVSFGQAGQQTAEEIGRFNRGFKSVFHVTRTVRIRSGRFEFSILDLLILHPWNPQPRDGETWQQTSFEWECPEVLAEELLQWNGRRPVAARVGAFDVRALIFLREVTVIVIHFRDQQWSWGMRRTEDGEEWSRVEIVGPDGIAQRFRVLARKSGQHWHGRARRFAIGFEVDSQNRPVRPVDAPLYLWFPTETSGPCGLWFNGDFDVAEDRLAVRDNSHNAALIKEALGFGVEEARRQIAANPEPAMWLAWAKMLAPQEGRDWVRARLPEDDAQLRAGFDAAAVMLAGAIPHGGRLRRTDQLRQPTQFLRRLAEKFAGEWQIETNEWIDAEIGAELDRFTDRTEKFSLESHIGEHRGRHDLLRKIRDAVTSQIFRGQWVRTAPEQQEHDRALNAISRYLPLEPVVVEPVSRSLADLLTWWKDERDLDPYTLDGDWWPLLFGGENENDRAATLRRLLSQPTDSERRFAWFKVLAVPCLLSIPRRVEQTRSFWQRELAARGFWQRTADGGFGAWTDELFAELVARPFETAQASGEDAEYWRRIFYDIRKVRALVFENDFADAIVDAAVSGIGLADFLRTGTLPDQRRWSGVLGQSASAPVFFLLREMHRLGIIPRDLHPPTLFVCRPVRKAAADFGLITPELAARYDFNSLLEASEQICEALKSDPAGRELLDDYDIPLLHWGLSR